MRILRALRNPVRLVVALIVAILFFDLNYFLMSRLPGEVDRMCVIGGYLNGVNIGFAVVMSALTGILVAGVLALYKQRRAKMAATSALSGVGLLVGTFTVFCTTCTIPVFSFWGLSIGLNFFTDFNLEFKILSFILMVVGIYLLNQQLDESKEF